MAKLVKLLLQLNKLKSLEVAKWKMNNEGWMKNEEWWLMKVEGKLDLESIMSSLRMDLEKEWISIGMDLDWDLKILNFMLPFNQLEVWGGGRGVWTKIYKFFFHCTLPLWLSSWKIIEIWSISALKSLGWVVYLWL